MKNYFLFSWKTANKVVPLQANRIRYEKRLLTADDRL